MPWQLTVGELQRALQSSHPMAPVTFRIPSGVIRDLAPSGEAGLSVWLPVKVEADQSGRNLFVLEVREFDEAEALDRWKSNLPMAGEEQDPGRDQ